MSNQRILIVEDDLIIQAFIEKIVKTIGCEIVGLTSSGDEAIKLTALKKPTVVIMDIGIEGKKDGVETAQIIMKKNGAYIIFLTGNSDKKTIERAKALNPLGIIYKPVNDVSLEQQLMALCCEIPPRT